jgi:hypothetical protein
VTAVPLPTPAFSEFGTVAGLVGSGWQHYLRVLHPAWSDRPDGASEAVRWADVGQRTGRSVDLSVASWFDVSGVRPHREELPPGVTREPDEALDARPLVARLLTGLDAGAAPLRLHNRTYAVWSMPLVEVLERLTADDEWPSLVANLVWVPGEWCVAADIDCMSTYVGTERLPHLDAQFEVWPVPPDARAS